MNNKQFKSLLDSITQVTLNENMKSFKEFVGEQHKPAQKSNGGGISKALDALQIAGDVVGTADPSPITDLANSTLSLGRAAYSTSTGDKAGAAEHTLDAGLRAVSAIPYAGDVVGKGGRAIKLGYKATTATSKLV